jgi:hypothetical protein
METRLDNLDSSYRAVGGSQRAVEILRGGTLRSPENHAVRVFLAIALHDLGGHGEATGILPRELAETSSDRWAAYYGRAIAYYAKRFSGGGGLGCRVFGASVSGG